MFGFQYVLGGKCIHSFQTEPDARLFSGPVFGAGGALALPVSYIERFELHRPLGVHGEIHRLGFSFGDLVDLSLRVPSLNLLAQLEEHPSGKSLGPTTKAREDHVGSAINIVYYVILYEYRSWNCCVDNTTRCITSVRFGLELERCWFSIVFPLPRCSRTC